jgi:hypothetical protein
VFFVWGDTDPTADPFGLRGGPAPSSSHVGKLQVQVCQLLTSYRHPGDGSTIAGPDKTQTRKCTHSSEAVNPRGSKTYETARFLANGWIPICREYSLPAVSGQNASYPEADHEPEKPLEVLERYLTPRMLSAICGGTVA